MDDAPTPPPVFRRFGPDHPATPLVISVPHAGRFYPPTIERMRAASWQTLIQLEDRYADRLIVHAVEEGAVAIVATHARAWIDLNRDETDMMDGAASTSARARAGLGLVPLRLGGRDLWRRSPTAGEIAIRIEQVHRPYHQAISQALAAAQACHGFALLIDCHSMPPLAPTGGRAARIVIGDRHGASASPAVGAAACAAVEAHGLCSARNAPYAGAHTLDRHARPAHGIEAIQVEVDRSLYLQSDLREPDTTIGSAARLLADIGTRALEAAAPPLARAAE